MGYPKIRIDKAKYRQNIRKMKNLLAPANLSMMAVTKVYCAEAPLIEILNEEHIEFLADSRLDNLKTIETDALKVLLRLPSKSSIEETVRHSDISLNSEWTIIQKLNEAAEKMNKTHKIILMVDIGDLREGVYYSDDFEPLVQSIEALPHIELFGLGTNVTCYGGVLPTSETIGKLNGVVKKVERILGRKIEMVSGGNSSHIPFLSETISPINNLRIGEALVLGRETSYGTTLEGFFDDVFILEAEIIELKEKPSYPEGEIGMNAFGKKPFFKDEGQRKRAIIALGKQDVDHNEIMPCDSSLHPIGSSSDHIIVDVTDAQKQYEVGDILTFKLTYSSILSLMTSPYVGKVYE